MPQCIILLFVVQFEFESLCSNLNLNVFVFLLEKKWKAFPSHSLGFQPIRPTPPSLSFSFFFFPPAAQGAPSAHFPLPGPNCSSACFATPSPSPLSAERGPPVGGLLLPPVRAGLQLKESSPSTRRRPAVLARTPRSPAPPLFKALHPP